jgi:hypothetical protein
MKRKRKYTFINVCPECAKEKLLTTSENNIWFTCVVCNKENKDKYLIIDDKEENNIEDKE